MSTISMHRELQELFEDLHASGLFPDGKEISDAELQAEPATILEKYRKEKIQNEFDLLAFYKANFSMAESRAASFTSDQTEDVEIHLEKLWHVLQRSGDTSEKPSTLIPLPYPYIVPGGRFNEIYYWDSYFTMLGLKVSGKHDLIESMVRNFSYLIEDYGFIPNGNRTYFLGRSQPPFFSLMVQLLAEIKGDHIFSEFLPSLEKEYNFWMKGASGESRMINLSGVRMNRYFDDYLEPRVEMWNDDVHLLKENGDKGKELLLHIRAACESGWDFSSRWLTDPQDLGSIHCADILPVDLNCLLWNLEKTLEKAYALQGAKTESNRFSALTTIRKEAIGQFFWNENFFYDFDFKNDQNTSSINAAGLYPLFFKLCSQEQADQCAEIIKTRLLAEGGLLTSDITSGQQWDQPNGWAPLQWIAFRGLMNYGHAQLANEIKTRWINLNRRVFRNTGKMLEKYNVVDVDLETGGGEYPVQDGFGWTNGVFLQLVNQD